VPVPFSPLRFFDGAVLRVRGGRTGNKGVKPPVSVRFFEHFYKAVKTYLHNTAGSRLVIV